jgi:hypothetical protein
MQSGAVSLGPKTLEYAVKAMIELTKKGLEPGDKVSFIIGEAPWQGLESETIQKKKDWEGLELQGYPHYGAEQKKTLAELIKKCYKK